MFLSLSICILTLFILVHYMYITHGVGRPRACNKDAGYMINRFCIAMRYFFCMPILCSLAMSLLMLTTNTVWVKPYNKDTLK